MSGSDQVAETCDACNRTEDLMSSVFFIYADFYSKSPPTTYLLLSLEAWDFLHSAKLQI